MSTTENLFLTLQPYLSEDVLQRFKTKDAFIGENAAFRVVACIYRMRISPALRAMWTPEDSRRMNDMVLSDFAGRLTVLLAELGDRCTGALASMFTIPCQTVNDSISTVYVAGVYVPGSTEDELQAQLGHVLSCTRDGNLPVLTVDVTTYKDQLGTVGIVADVART